MNSDHYVINDTKNFDFQVNRRSLVDQSILDLEMEKIFDKCWIYVGHESEVKTVGDFKTRNVCGRPVILCRDMNSNIRVYLNACRHRAAVVCRESEGNTRSFFCFYHGWSYNINGELDGVPGKASYPPSFDPSKLGLAEPAHVDSYKGFIFLTFNQNASSLVDYLAGATEYIDLIVDQSPSGKMEVIKGTQEYDIKANWKLLVENSFDDYHLITTHSTWLNYMKRSGVEIKKPEKGHLMPSHGIGKVFHQDPQILHYGRPGTGEKLEQGMTFTIEPMINAGRREIRTMPDQWTVKTKDRSLSAQWEHTLLVTATGVEVLTWSAGSNPPPDCVKGLVFRPETASA